MNLKDHYTFVDDTLSFTREKASAFAKEVAGDFNPIHDPDARRFCVPGDLLFAVVLDLYQARENMEFEFEQMVDERVALEVQERDEGFTMSAGDKQYLSVSCSGAAVESQSANASLIDAYVKFSGQTFPFLLVDLMQKNKVMINPQRPLVIYKSMSLSLLDTRCEQFDLSFTDSSLRADGKKGEVALQFDIVSDDKVVGKGQKNMLLGGLREYDQNVIDELVSEYNQIKSRYLQCHA